MNDKGQSIVLSVVIPVFNEEEVLAGFFERLSVSLRRLHNVAYEIIFVTTEPVEAVAKRLERMLIGRGVYRAVFPSEEVPFSP